MSKKHRKRPHIPTGGETVEINDMIGPDFIGTEGMRTALASEDTEYPVYGSHVRFQAEPERITFPADRYRQQKPLRGLYYPEP